jgi:L-fucose mutarotase/ribose pyranase (RbsD/FucU family)
MKRMIAAALFAMILGSLAFLGPVRSQPPVPPFAQQAPPGWKHILRQRLVEYGHRNWIVVADSAYPAQSRSGIETVLTGDDHLKVVGFVLAEIEKQKHVRPRIYLDAELPYVSEKDAPDIRDYRSDLKDLLGERKPASVLHEDLIAKLDKTGAAFNILVLKTTMMLPYTSVFIELDCGYWSAEAEKRLREAMKAKE